MAFITHTVINYSLLTINSLPIALRMFSRVTSGRMASSRGRVSGDIWMIRANPICLRHALSSTFPAISMTGMLAFFALFNTPAGTFPSAVCLSAFPSPVIIQSAFVIFRSKSTASNSRPMPDCKWACRKVANAPPNPPDAPDPFTLFIL